MIRIILLVVLLALFGYLDLTNNSVGQLPEIKITDLKAELLEDVDYQDNELDYIHLCWHKQYKDKIIWSYYENDELIQTSNKPYFWRDCPLLK